MAATKFHTLAVPVSVANFSEKNRRTKGPKLSYALSTSMFFTRLYKIT
jgi:hypothetical protein